MSEPFLIGEKLNSTRPSVKRIFEERDEAALAAAAEAQIAGGASCIDLNASMLMGGEKAGLQWAARLVRERFRVPVSLDSPDLGVLIETASELGAEAVINSITCDEAALRETCAAAARSGTGVIVMLKDRSGIPGSAEGRVALAERAAAIAAESGVAPGRVFLDPVVTPLATTRGGLGVVLETTHRLAGSLDAYRRICGLSNVSFGLPERKLVNRAFAAMLVAAGMNSFICDTTDRELVSVLTASEAIIGSDPNCRRLLESYRAARKGV
jgi:cobalamin-dependent methionine synthase I